MKVSVLILSVVLAWVTPGLRAQPAASDTDTPEHILQALYQVISGPVGQVRNWDRFRALFLPESRLGYVVATPEGNRMVVFGAEEYIQGSTETLTSMGFHELEIHRKMERFGPLVHAWSTYEGHRDSPTGEILVRGINSITLVELEGRWYILQVFWHPESSATPLPEMYLPR